LYLSVRFATDVCVGGALESPAKKFPYIFDRVQFFHDYPYAFPGFVVSSLSLTAALLATFVIKEVSSLLT
jgi:hypothetical protein